MSLSIVNSLHTDHLLSLSIVNSLHTDHLLSLSIVNSLHTDHLPAELSLSIVNSLHTDHLNCHLVLLNHYKSLYTQHLPTELSLSIANSFESVTIFVKHTIPKVTLKLNNQYCMIFADNNPQQIFMKFWKHYLSKESQQPRKFREIL